MKSFKFNRAALVAISLAGCMASSASFAQIPVTVTSDVPGLGFHIEDIAKYVEQIEQMKAQVQQLEQTYNSLNGTRGIGQLFQNPNLQSMLPSDWQNVYSSVQGGGYSGISGSVQQIIQQEQSRMGGTQASGRQAVQDRQAQIAAYDKAMGQQAYTAAVQRLTNIQGLMGKINTSTDPKAIADLQARIQGEQAAIQNEQTKVQLMAQLQASEDRLTEAQRDQTGQKALASTNRAIPSLGSQ